MLVNFMSLVGVCGNSLKGERVSFGHTLRFDGVQSPSVLLLLGYSEYKFVLEACCRAKQLMSSQVGSKEEE